jgi:YebC/PmpR family DNA-binding regulatory protein
VQKARQYNMPSENIDRAIKHAAGEGEGVNLIETTLEGYGPGGVAILLQVVSDNRNRALQEIRRTLSRGGGSLGEAGCVAWLFETKGVITIEASGQQAEEAALYAIDAGAEDVKIEKGYLEIHTKLEELETVRKAMEQKNLPLISADMSMVPKTTMELEEKTAWQALKLLDQLEELDDVQRVFSNIDFSDEVLEKLRG